VTLPKEAEMPVEPEGYRATVEDLEFVRVTGPSIVDMMGRRCPLGMTPESFEHFIRTLNDALQVEGVTNADVRIQGSAAGFFTGSHKKLPVSRTEVFRLYEEFQERVPDEIEITRVLTQIASRWPDECQRPSVRMFDLLHVLKIDLQRSDIDVQISCDGLFRASRQKIDELGLPESEFLTVEPGYGFVKKYIIRKVAPRLQFWADQQSLVNGRLVSVAVFPGRGPGRSNNENLSSHFRENDFIVRRAAGDAT
jgi:hypothetical protein